jgi:hypothetical protein
MVENNEEKDYEIMDENCRHYDLVFKIVIMGNSGKYIFDDNRCWKIVFISKSEEEYFQW